jgi:hypothetical protein
LIEILSAVALIAAAQPSDICMAAAHRVSVFLIEEAKGTRHEKQIQESIQAAGNLDSLVAQIAAVLQEDQCAFLLTAPDSTVRAMAISMLPERSGR